jgi:hypothetical protein
MSSIRKDWNIDCRPRVEWFIVSILRFRPCLSLYDLAKRFHGSNHIHSERVTFRACQRNGQAIQSLLFVS